MEDLLSSVSNEDESPQFSQFDAVASEDIKLREMLIGFLFVSLKPLSISDLANLSQCSEEDVAQELSDLINEIESLEMGIEIRQTGEAYQIRTVPKLAKVLQRMITPRMKRLSKAAAETLAVVVYKQPVSKAEIEAIRGVDPLPTLRTLLDAKLIRIVGREDTPGSPALYGTTEFFLEKFGLKDLSELPTIREISELDSELSESQDCESETDKDDDIQDLIE